MGDNNFSVDFDPGGEFGYWIEDEAGLPAYEYTCDQDNDSRAASFTTAGPSRLHWHQVGNGRITALATNYGYIQALEGSRGGQWLNFRDTARLCPGGGIALIREDNEYLTDLYEQGTSPPDYRRIFGCGYFRKIKKHNGLLIDHYILAPYGDDPALITRIVVRNESGQTRHLEIGEFFGICLRYISRADVYTSGRRRDFCPGEFLNNIASGLNTILSPIFDVDERRASFADRFVFRAHLESQSLILLSPEYTGVGKPVATTRSGKNYYPKPLFIGSLSGHPDLICTMADELVSPDGGFTTSAAGRAIHPGKIKRPCLCMGFNTELEPGSERKLLFIFGAAEKEMCQQLLEKYDKIVESGTDLSLWNGSRWKKAMPSLELPGMPASEQIASETMWHFYYSKSASLYHEYYDCHYAPQGGVYEYLQGFRGSVRDFGLFSAGLIYFDPCLARETIEYCFRTMEPSGRLMYATYGFGKATGVIVHENPSDLQLFLLWALTDYILFTGDEAFLDLELPLHPDRSRRRTIRKSVEQALDYFYTKIGLGEHGLARVGDGDWSDGIALFVRDRRRFVKEGESAFNTAMAIYVLPRLAGVLDKWNRREAEKARSYAASLKEAVLNCYNGRWFFRGYDGKGTPIGDKHLFLEHHTWLLISRVLPDNMARSVIENVYKILDKPSRFGQYVLYPPLKTRLEHYAPGWDVNGGVWFAMNFLLTWAYGYYDPNKAWYSLVKNSMAMKATIDPCIWYGIWSGPDSFNADHARRPGETFYHLPTPGTDFPVMNLNLHACFLLALTRLCGLDPMLDKQVAPALLPTRDFRIETPVISLAVEAGETHFTRKFPTKHNQTGIE